MGEPQTLSDEQIARIEAVIDGLAQRGNAWGIGIGKQLKGKSQSDKRRLILGAVGQMWEAMLGVQMAMDSSKSAAEIKAALERSGRR